jgi:ribosomal protein S18 acetylase RimI-like enzyme
MNMTSYNYKISTPTEGLSRKQMDEIIDFLFVQLEQYGDKKPDIRKAIEYAMQINSSPGGYVLTCRDDETLMGAVVVNKTGMSGYIPENILVYIAVHKDTRGKGVGKSLMELALKCAEGDMALHVEPENPAKFLYEKLGFENKYLEMRYKRKLPIFSL